MKKGNMTDEHKAAMAEGRRKANEKKAALKSVQKALADDIHISGEIPVPVAEKKQCDGCKKLFDKAELRPENPLTESPDEKWFCFECMMARPEPESASVVAEPGSIVDSLQKEIARIESTEPKERKPEPKMKEVFGVYVASGTEEIFRNLIRTSARWQDKAYAKGVRDTLAWVLGDNTKTPTGIEVKEEVAS
jgi:hypothetical protein